MLERTCNVAIGRASDCIHIMNVLDSEGQYKSNCFTTLGSFILWVAGEGAPLTVNKGRGTKKATYSWFLLFFRTDPQKIWLAWMMEV